MALADGAVVVVLQRGHAELARLQLLDRGLGGVGHEGRDEGRGCGWTGSESIGDRQLLWGHRCLRRSGLRARRGNDGGDLQRRNLLVEDLLDACLQLGLGRGLPLVQLGIARVEFDEAGDEQGRLVGDALDEGFALLHALCRFGGACSLPVSARLQVQLVGRHGLLHSSEVVALRRRVLGELGEGRLGGSLLGPEAHKLLLDVGGLPQGRQREDGRLQELQVRRQGLLLRRLRIGVRDAHQLVEDVQRLLAHRHLRDRVHEEAVVDRLEERGQHVEVGDKDLG